MMSCKHRVGGIDKVYVQTINQLLLLLMQHKYYFTALSHNLQQQLIEFCPQLLVKSPEIIFLAGGLPNPQMFPFQAASITLKDGRAITLHPQEMNAALQYGPTPGYTLYFKRLKELTKRLHDPPNWENFETIVTAGSQDGLCKSFEMMLNPGDYVVTQEPVYTGTLSIMNPYKPKYLPIGTDADGMNPEKLREALARWDPLDVRNATEGVPKVMYINPNACNPTGVSVSPERRKEIYAIAQEYNLIILEDDPYYFVQFGDYKDYPSFLSIDTDGRVLRFDSFSKILSSGIRIGYATGAKPLINQILLHEQASILHAPSMSQVMLFYLFEMWAEDLFSNFTEKMADFSTLRENEAKIQKCSRKLSGLCEWSIPTGGMFLWLRVPGVQDTWSMIMDNAVEAGVILVPGKAFMTDTNKPCQYMRAAFSLAAPEKIDQGFASMAETLTIIRREVKVQTA
ncbi:unnamed protein product, partial [Meganyctiphanes norvegica]